jgi:hypothetical protein
MLRHVLRAAIPAAVSLASMAYAVPAMAAVSLAGKNIKITENIGATYLGFGFYSGASSAVFNRTISGGAEIAGTGANDWLGLPLLPTTLDIDPLNNRVWIRYYDYAYGIRIDNAPWTVEVKLAPNSGVHFTSTSHIYNDSAYQGAYAVASGDTLTFTLTGGFLNNVSQAGQVFNSIWDIGIAANGASGVPEPASWAFMLAGFAAAGAAMRRRSKLSVTYA